MTQKLDILVFAAHPDDAELACAGTMAKHTSAGKKVGIVDLTRGEMGTRGTVEIRAQEAADAAKILGLQSRINLGLRDGFISSDEASVLKVVETIRLFQPEIVIANAFHDRHPDHGAASELVERACFVSGLQKVETKYEGKTQTPWRPKKVLHYIQDRYIQPDVIVDISEYWDQKEASIKAYKSQFYDPNSKEPDTYISSPQFLEYVKARAIEMGHAIGTKYGEGFTCKAKVGVKNLFDIV